MRIRIPGFAGATGGDIIFSDAEIPCGSAFPLLVAGAVWDVGGVWVPEIVPVVGELVSLSGVMVDVEEEREKVFARGARCVSLSSIERQYVHPPEGLHSQSHVRTLG